MSLGLVVLLLLLHLQGTSARRYNTSSAPLRGAINVHLIAASHDDVGWLKSPQECESGLPATRQAGEWC